MDHLPNAEPGCEGGGVIAAWISPIALAGDIAAAFPNEPVL